MASHLASLWNRGLEQFGNGLLFIAKVILSHLLTVDNWQTIPVLPWETAFYRAPLSYIFLKLWFDTWYCLKKWKNSEEIDQENE